MYLMDLSCQEAESIYISNLALERIVINKAKSTYDSIVKSHHENEFSWEDKDMKNMMDLLNELIRINSMKKFIVDNYAAHVHKGHDYLDGDVQHQIEGAVGFAMDKIAFISLLKMKKIEYITSKNNQSEASNLDW